MRIVLRRSAFVGFARNRAHWSSQGTPGLAPQTGLPRRTIGAARARLQPTLVPGLTVRSPGTCSAADAAARWPNLLATLSQRIRNCCSIRLVNRCAAPLRQGGFFSEEKRMSHEQLPDGQGPERYDSTVRQRQQLPHDRRLQGRSALAVLLSARRSLFNCLPAGCFFLALVLSLLLATWPHVAFWRLLGGFLRDL